MIEETGRVVAVEGEFAWVETQRQTTCGACAANKGCGTAVLGKVLGLKRNRLRVVNQLHLNAGDAVVLGIEERALVRGSLAVYTAPLVAMFIAVLGGDGGAAYLGIPYTEGWRIIFALAGLGAGFAWLYMFAGRVRDNPHYQAVVRRKLMPTIPAETTQQV